MNKSFLLMLFVFSVFFYSGFAAAIKGEKRIFLEYQAGALNNQDRAQDIAPEWSNASANRAYGQVGFDLKLWSHKIKLSSFLHHSQSTLIEDKQIGVNYFIFPHKVIGRDLFKLEHSNTTKDSRSDVVLNNFVYEWSDEEIDIKFGRLFIQYGEGLGINPINPFNHNITFANTQGVNMANDGFEILLARDPKFKLYFYFLGDKSYTDYDEKLTRTILLRGEWKKSHKVLVNYIVGEDQNRHKYGFEVKYKAKYGFGFAQLVKNSQLLDSEDKEAKGLTHYLLGYELILNPKWISRIEIGKIQNSASDDTKINNNYLPIENIISWFNFYNIQDNWMAEIHLAVDPESEFSPYKISNTYSFKQYYSARIFASGAISSAKDDTDYADQDLIPGQIGAAIRGAF
ncbi:MAG: hypothetical protein HON90_01595 [Halobacteriovoraceae bacterium]|jgi:hypothetical protein|nr:hypothetical protein [Halobacteriovoraceae bacterium]